MGLYRPFIVRGTCDDSFAAFRCVNISFRAYQQQCANTRSGEMRIEKRQTITRTLLNRGYLRGNYERAILRVASGNCSLPPSDPSVTRYGGLSKFSKFHRNV